MSEHLVCGECGYERPVSDEDPDGTLSDMVDHVRYRHGAGPEQAMHAIHLDARKETR